MTKQYPSNHRKEIMNPSSGVYGSNDSCVNEEGSPERMGAIKQALLSLEKK